MSGSGSGHQPPSRSPGGLGGMIHQAEDGVARASYEQQVNALLEEAVSESSDRDVEAIRRHIETIQQALESEVEGTVDMRFGGSTQRHTYVNGLSDVDLLARIGDSTLADSSAQEVLQSFAERLQKRLPNTNVSPGNLAVTVCYSDGHELQILPALSTATGVRIPTPSGDGWSNVIKPDAFARKLTKVNQDCGGKVVPTIKLFKSAQESLPVNSRLSGYHTESLAVKAFEGYQGRRTYKDMLMHLCRSAAEDVKAPISDRTGQSVHVDDYLGAANSEARQSSSSSIGRLARRLEIADRDRQIKDWEKLFGDG